MTSSAADRYRRAKAIAFAALDLGPEKRLELVGAECGDDEPLRREVLWLIEAAENADSSDDPSATVRLAAGQAAEAVRLEAPLPRDYRLLERLGEGGMGVVYLAERVDGNLRQRVALKLLHLGLGEDEALARRFAAERQILASLNHPNIAHLVDGGLTAEGRPFLALEHVEGERIDRWCERRSLPLKSRIELFLKVCAAVEHAHQRLVIHRDIKPVNILVTAAGEPKLLDFGIARLVDEEAGATRTRTLLRVMTPAYASPEQIEGQALSTATDVYSLGVVLYELVAGVRPFDHLASTHSLSHAIVAGEITPPSRQTQRHGTKASREPASERLGSRSPLGWRIPADIDAIVLKAMRREPERRYASVAELMGDLRAFLDSRPVAARRGHWIYRTQRFAWRRRGLLAAAGLFAALLLGFVLHREAQLERIAWERDRAEAVTEFMNDLFQNADSLPSRGNEVTVREMLDRGAQELQVRKGLDPTLKRSMLLTMGRAYNALALGDEALPLLRSAQALLGTTSTGNLEERATILTEMGRAHSSRVDLPAAIAADAEAIELLRQSGDDTADAILRLRLRKLSHHSTLLDTPLSGIITQLRDIVAALEDRREPTGELLYLAYDSLSAVYSIHGAREQAVEMSEKAIAWATHDLGPEHPQVLNTRRLHASALSRVDAGRSLELYEALIADIERLVGPGIVMANAYNGMGGALMVLGRFEESAAAIQKAIDLVPDSADPGNRFIYTQNLALSHCRRGEPAEAEALLRELLPEVAARAASDRTARDHVIYAATLRTLAEVLVHQSKSLEAEQTYGRAQRLLETVDPNAHRLLRASIQRGLAATRLTLERPAAAGEALEHLDALLRRLELDPGDRLVLGAAALRVQLLNATGEHRAAERLATEAHNRACREGKPLEEPLNDLRAAWTTAIEHLDRPDAAQQLPKCTPIAGAVVAKSLD